MRRSYHFGKASYLGGINIIFGIYQEIIYKPNVSVQLAFMNDIIKPSAFAELL